MRTRAHRWIVLAAIISVGAGTILSHIIEPGVRFEKIMLTAHTPALRIFPETPGPYPKVVLAHGNGGSKEMMFRFGEALAAAGFDCYSVDQAGYGESPQTCSHINVRRYFVEAERALGEVDVFIGHSMGGGTGSWSVREAGFRPKLFIAVGNTATLGEHGPPSLLLFGRFDEFRPMFGSSLKPQTNGQLIFSPWSEHILEVYDPVLVKYVVRAACATEGKPEPAGVTAWRWRFAGLVMGITGALGLMLALPELHPIFARNRRYIVPGILLIVFELTLGKWVGVTPQIRRFPQQLVLLPVILLMLAGLGRLRLPRWSLAVVTGILAIGCLPIIAYLESHQVEKYFFFTFTLMCALLVSTLLMFPAIAVGRIAARHGSRWDGDIAMAIFAAYVIGQFMPICY